MPNFGIMLEAAGIVGPKNGSKPLTGDILGSAYEFHNTKDYNFRLFLSENAYTDDNVTTIAVAYWLLRDPSHSYRELEFESSPSFVIFAIHWSHP